MPDLPVFFRRVLPGVFALLASSTLWALDSDGDGIHDTAGPITTPMVSAGYEHTCALDTYGVHCWGEAADGLANSHCRWMVYSRAA